MTPNRTSADKSKLKRTIYEKELRKLQVQLCRLQDWVKHKGLRVIIVFEGRDAAGKGGTIKAISERVSPRVFRVVALPAPSSREKTQMYFQRYIPYFPAAGEVIIFDRSWYNRAGVEYVMGFCTEEDHRQFLIVCPEVEQYIVDGGIVLIKFWLEVGKEEQERRFLARIHDPLRQWKLSPMDLESYERWYQYSKARDIMLKATDTKFAPWHIVRSDDKRRARTQLHFAYPENGSGGQNAALKSQTAPALEQGQIRRSSWSETNEFRRREILTQSDYAVWTNRSPGKRHVSLTYRLLRTASG